MTSNELRVVCPFVPGYLNDETVAALERCVLDFELVDTSGDDLAYWRLLRQLWADGKDFVIVEHDNVIRDDVLTGFTECRELWCLHAYQTFPHDHPNAQLEGHLTRGGLGCVRFRAELLKRSPEVVESIPEDRRVWNGLDTSLADELWRVGVMRAHVHWPVVQHLHHGPPTPWPEWTKVPSYPEIQDEP